MNDYDKAFWAMCLSMAGRKSVMSRIIYSSDVAILYAFLPVNIFSDLHVLNECVMAHGWCIGTYDNDDVVDIQAHVRSSYYQFMLPRKLSNEWCINIPQNDKLIYAKSLQIRWTRRGIKLITGSFTQNGISWTPESGISCYYHFESWNSAGYPQKWQKHL